MYENVTSLWEFWWDFKNLTFYTESLCPGNTVFFYSSSLSCKICISSHFFPPAEFPTFLFSFSPMVDSLNLTCVTTLTCMTKHICSLWLCMLLRLTELTVAAALTLLHKPNTCPLLEVPYNLKMQWDVCWHVHHVLLQWICFKLFILEIWDLSFSWWWLKNTHLACDTM
jgi:hypothetical protein